MELYKDKSQPVGKRVEDLLSRMTIEEKAAQLCGHLPFVFMKDGKVDKDTLKAIFPDGHGRFTQFSILGLADPVFIAEVGNELQRYFVEETRLGIPVALQSENLCGYPGAGGTLFPSMINLASTWEPELAGEMTAVIGNETRSVGINSAMSPVIDVSRDPRWGRTYETFGEDPYLVTQMGVNYINGMQAGKTGGVACIAKHFLGYAETQGGLNCAKTRINSRELYEIFASPFEAAAKAADVSGVMASYSDIDGLPVAANKEISCTLLRDTMGFKGMLTSDGAGIMRLWNANHIAKTYEEAGLIAKKAGVDTEIPIGAAFAKLPEYVREGKLEEALLDESVRRILTIKFEYGLFENPYVDVEKVRSAMCNPQKQALSEKIAAESLILLKNDGILPLEKSKRIALIGPHADNLRYPISGYTYPAYIEMLDSMRNNEESVSFGGIADEAAKMKKEKKSANNPFAAMFSALPQEDVLRISDMDTVLGKMGARSLREILGERFELNYSKGCNIIGDDTSLFEEAVQAARESDIAILALGGNCGWFNVTGGEGKDRCSIDLPGVQQKLLEAVASAGKPVVVILYGPGCFAVNWAAEHASAIVQAWMPGPFAGKTVADLLDGAANPGGKLPVSIPRSIGQVPIYYNHYIGSGYIKDTDDAFASSILSGGYVDGDDKPLYPFGHGLSYTSFAVSEFSVADKEIPTGGVVRVSCRVKNTGNRQGSEVVQLYTRFKDAHVSRPNKSLSGFVRVNLAPGEEKEIGFALQTAQLGYYNEDMAFVVEPGRMDIMLGTSSHNIVFSEEIMLTGKTLDIAGKRAYTCDVNVKGRIECQSSH